MGYHRAGFEVIGVDGEPQPRYPFRFIQADLRDFGVHDLADADAVTGSPTEWIGRRLMDHLTGAAAPVA